MKGFGTSNPTPNQLMENHMSRNNEARIVGHVGSTPEIRFTSGGTKVTTLSVATNEKWTDKSGNKQESTEWHKCVMFAGLADICEKYAPKGKHVMVSGRIQTRKWTDKAGDKSYTTEIVGDQIKLL